MAGTSKDKEDEFEIEEPLFLQTNDPEDVTDRDEGTYDFSTVPDCSILPIIDTEKQLQNIMDCILPPRTFEAERRKWKTRTSTVPATRVDMVALEERFEAELKDRRAKPFGVCPIRRHLYDELYDELIRQVTVGCAERGLMLLRVRDEIRMTLLAYQSLLESAIAYGLRKAITVENEQSKAILERNEERAKNQDLQMKIIQLEKKIATDKVVNDEELEILEQRMREENERLIDSNKTLKHQLQAILQMDHVNPADISIAQQNEEK